VLCAVKKLLTHSLCSYALYKTIIDIDNGICVTEGVKDIVNGMLKRWRGKNIRSRFWDLHVDTSWDSPVCTAWRSAVRKHKRSQITSGKRLVGMKA